MYKYIGKWYFYSGLVGKIEEQIGQYSPRQDNGFDGKIGRLIGYNYCRLIPEIIFNF